MRVRLPHSNGLFLSRWGTPLTDLRASVPDGKRLCPGKFVPVSKIEGNVPCLGAKSIHFVGYLPTPCGQEFWQILSQWTWNLRLELGHRLSPTAMRTTELAKADAVCQASPTSEDTPPS